MHTDKTLPTGLPPGSIERTELYAAVEKLWYWQVGGDSFSCKFFDLFAKADLENQAKLGSVYPADALAFKMWRDAESAESFFKEFELIPPGTGNDR